MPKAHRSRHHEAPRDRAPAERVVACELRPFAHPVSDALVLAATERAERHHTTRTGAGVLLGEVFAHMGSSTTGRRLGSCGRASTRSSQMAPSNTRIGRASNCGR